jgi:lipoate---protein ligase
MSLQWKVIDSGRLAASEVMAKDSALLSQISQNQVPMIHFYEWKTPCLTYGYFTDPLRHLNGENLERYGIEMARRPTGGGIIFHLSDFAFSILIPSKHPFFSSNTLQCYRCINEKVAQAVEECCLYSPTLFESDHHVKEPCGTFCMERATIYDLIFEGKKAGGAAQRKSRNGFLHQGSLSLTMPPFEVLQEVFIDGEQKIASIRQNSFYLLGDHVDEPALLEGRRKLRHALIANFVGDSGVVA